LLKQQKSIYAGVKPNCHQPVAEPPTSVTRYKSTDPTFQTHRLPPYRLTPRRHQLMSRPHAILVILTHQFTWISFVVDEKKFHHFFLAQKKKENAGMKNLRAPNAQDESDCGIISCISKLPSFLGILKQRFNG
jgi:hypothetical protein